MYKLQLQIVALATVFFWAISSEAQNVRPITNDRFSCRVRLLENDRAALAGQNALNRSL